MQTRVVVGSPVMVVFAIAGERGRSQGRLPVMMCLSQESAMLTSRLGGQLSSVDNLHCAVKLVLTPAD